MIPVLLLDLSGELCRLDPLPHGWRLKRLQGKRQGYVYDVTEEQPGLWWCTCDDMKWRGTGRPGYRCKHITALFDTGLLRQLTVAGHGAGAV